MKPDSYRQVTIMGRTLMGEQVYRHMESKVSNEEEWFHDVLCIVDKFNPGVKLEAVAWVDIDTHETGFKKRTEDGWIESNDEVFQQRFWR